MVRSETAFVGWSDGVLCLGRKLMWIVECHVPDWSQSLEDIFNAQRWLIDVG